MEKDKYEEEKTNSKLTFIKIYCNNVLFFESKDEHEHQEEDESKDEYKDKDGDKYKVKKRMKKKINQKTKIPQTGDKASLDRCG